jgi:uncharacterized protein (TIGR02217 family)
MPQYPLEWTSEFKNIISTAESGVEERRQQWRFPRRSASLKYQVLSRAEMDEIWNFYISRKGALGTFIFLEPDITPYSRYQDEFVGHGDGSLTRFEIPARNASNIVPYIDGVDVSSTNPIQLVPYSGLSGVTPVSGEVSAVSGEVVPADSGISGGARDSIIFSSPPAVGSVITVDFTGQLALTVRFTQDKLTRQMFRYILFNIGIGITEVKKAS